MSLPRQLSALFLSILAFGRLLGAEHSPDYSSEIRPILSNHCFSCHGPDESNRKADLRLDTQEGIAAVIRPDDLASSLIHERIHSADADVVMPPPDFHKPLSEDQKKTLSQWIASGGHFETHWAFTAPQKTSPAESELHRTIDRLLDQRILAAGLTINPRADDRTLLRRVCLDLTGLPPSRDQIQSFVQDKSPDRYQRLVDQLIASPEFGRHVGRHWLDLVRYADTHGLHLDNYREMWPYRDWVIRSFNHNLPFDEFITKQLAGDLMEGATDEDRIASGYNRLNVTTNEGGSIYDEVFARNCIDLTDAFGTVFLGLTTQCATCHDHKFDPITQKDYYSLLAFFNSLDGQAMDGNVKDHPPSIPVPTAEQRQLQNELQLQLEQLDLEMVSPILSVDQAQRDWELALANPGSDEHVALVPTSVSSREKVPVEIRQTNQIRLMDNAAAKDVLTLTTAIPAGTSWQTIQLEALVDPKTDRVGVSENGNVVLSEIKVSMRPASSDGEWDSIPIEAAFASHQQSGDSFSIEKAIDGIIDAHSGWAVGGHESTGPRTAWFYIPGLVAQDGDAELKIALSFESQFAKHQFYEIRLSASRQPPAIPAEQRITLSDAYTAGPFEVESANAATYSNAFPLTSPPQLDSPIKFGDKEFRWQKSDDYPQVRVSKTQRIADRSSYSVLYRNLISPRDQSITLLYDADDGLILQLNGQELKRQVGKHEIDPLSKSVELPLKKGDNYLYLKTIDYGGEGRLSYALRSLQVELPASVREMAATQPSQRDETTKRALQQYYRLMACVHDDWIALRAQRQATHQQLNQLKKSITTTLVWKELPEPRTTHILNRGQYDDLGDAVTRDVPSFLPPLPASAPRNRLGLAAWATDPANPLPARVAVNRFWQIIFGTGIVKTSEDFGSQGEAPSHRELLDTIAVHFVESGWDVKRLLRELVLTEAYRRDSKSTPAMLKVDPENRLYARGPRHRLDAETLRDQALFLSGLLVSSEGGPSVKPPQPVGLWEAVGYTSSDTAKFVADVGDKPYLRSVYVFWKRTSAPPQMTTLDAPSREYCTARRERTNTPLQALLLMNETQYHQAAGALADQALSEAGLDDKSRIQWIFETVTARLPNRVESDEMMELLGDLLAYYESQPKLADQFMGGSTPQKAAWTILASTMLNLDEVVSK
jgi:Protein of unknown function (DUF1553)/Protein of unknown function (DUF1549)/Planctomycete cytochrome C